MSVSVMIASMGRPSLKRTLETVRAASLLIGEELEIIVADDSPDGAVSRLLGEAVDGVHVVPVGAQNVSIARNACLDAARGDWLLFVDDDEYVEPDWIAGHLAVADQYGADAVFGPVYHQYPETTPAWLKVADPLFQDWHWAETGRKVAYGRTGNTLIRRSCLERLGLRFDQDFGKTGGEDHDFFRRMAASGATMVVTDRAVAHEIVPEDRAQPDYVLRRMRRFGQSHALIALRGASPLGRTVFGVDATIKMGVAGLACLAIRPFSRPRAFHLQMKLASNIGKLQMLAGARLGSSWI